MTIVTRNSLKLFLLLILILIFPLTTSPGETVDDIPPSCGPRDWLDTTPVFGEPGPLVYKRTGFTYSCRECHTDFQNLIKYYQPAGEHSRMEFDHGRNLNCRNCHNDKNREVYIDHDGTEIPPNQTTRLCSKCHGPSYRDWEADIHGRVNGSWDPDLGPQKKLDCIQCHDPHKPQFIKMSPMAPPAVSRKGTPHE